MPRNLYTNRSGTIILAIQVHITLCKNYSTYNWSYLLSTQLQLARQRFSIDTPTIQSGLGIIYIHKVYPNFTLTDQRARESRRIVVGREATAKNYFDRPSARVYVRNYNQLAECQLLFGALVLDQQIKCTVRYKYEQEFEIPFIEYIKIQLLHYLLQITHIEKAL